MTLANAAPTPMKKLWMANPSVRCFSPSLSAMNGRNGSIVELMLKSWTHRIVAATQSTGEVGMKNSAMLEQIAPPSRNGLRRPKRDLVARGRLERPERVQRRQSAALVARPIH